MKNTGHSDRKAGFVKKASWNAVLNSIQTNLFIADMELNLVYMNDKAAESLEQHRAVIKQIFRLNIEEVLGGSIHRFHRDPARVEAILRDGFKLPHSARFSFGTVTLETRINALKDESGKQIGYIVNWEDVSQAEKLERERRLREEAAALTVSDASSGDLAAAATHCQSEELGELGQNLRELIRSYSTGMKSLQGTAKLVEDSSSKMATTADEVIKSSGSNAERVNQVTTSNTEVTDAMTAVAAAITELDQSIQDISRNATLGKETAEAASSQAENARKLVDRLESSSKDIRQVIDLIRNIADQTNLLALNATIEAARAGEAGKGFEVVAGEIKNLARETARATDQVGETIKRILGETEEVAVAIEEARRVILGVSEAQSGIASAVTEQAATTSELGGTVNMIAGNARNITESLQEVNSNIQQVQQGMEAMHGMISGFRQNSSEMKAFLGRYRLLED
jgi:methyl-accepting chemotaxis protein